jgi:asparagine synthase (glutamine-hydrolysing)
LLNASAVRKKWEEHISGRRDWHHWLWNVLVFQAWNERWNTR